MVSQRSKWIMQGRIRRMLHSGAMGLLHVSTQETKSHWGLFIIIVAKKICSQLHLLECTFLHLLCCSTVTIQRRISLRSSAQAELLVPRARTAIQERRPFSGAGLTAWNGLPGALRLTPVAHSSLFLSSLKKTTLTEVGLGALLSRLPWSGAI